MRKHTPGPWRSAETIVWALDETGTVNRFCAAVCGGYVLHSERAGGSIRTSAEELAANTRLIAAAPQLLEALEEAEKDLAACSISIHRDLVHRGNTMWEGVPEILDARIKHIRAAIAAAKGETR